MTNVRYGALAAVVVAVVPLLLGGCGSSSSAGDYYTCTGTSGRSCTSWQKHNSIEESNQQALDSYLKSNGQRVPQR